MIPVWPALVISTSQVAGRLSLFMDGLISYKSMFRFEKLEIWQLAISYGSKIYDFANTLPKEELFGLSSQLKRAAVSISNNIAEGSGGTTNRDFRNFLDISVKSALEVISMLSFCKKRNFINVQLLAELYEESEKLIRKINAFKKSLN